MTDYDDKPKTIYIRPPKRKNTNHGKLIKRITKVVF